MGGWRSAAATVIRIAFVRSGAARPGLAWRRLRGSAAGARAGWEGCVFRRKPITFRRWPESCGSSNVKESSARAPPCDGLFPPVPVRGRQWLPGGCPCARATPPCGGSSRPGCRVARPPAPKRASPEVPTKAGLGDPLRRAKGAGPSWPLPEGMDARALEAWLLPAPAQVRCRGGRTFTPSGGARGTPCRRCGRSTRPSTPTGFATAGSASAAAPCARVSMGSCASRIAPARRRSWTPPDTRRPSWTARAGRRCSGPGRGRRATSPRMRGPPGRRRGPTGAPPPPIEAPGGQARARCGFPAACPNPSSPTARVRR